MRTYRLIWLLLLLWTGGCAQQPHSVRYQVSGSAATIAISYVNPTGATEQRNVSGAWSTTFTAPTWRYVGITVFNPTAAGTVSCRLYVDNVLVQEATSAGGFKAAVCSTLAGVTDRTPTPKR